MTEPMTSALFIASVGLLLSLAVGFSRLWTRTHMPLALGFLLLGVLAGSEGIGRIPYEDYHLTFQVGVVTLALILFDGGMNTPASAIREAIVPAGLLATLGVVLTTLSAAGAARLFGFSWPEALVVGAIVSPTDSAAVFSALTASGTHLKQRVAHLLELESGLNDPMAVILTTAFTANLVKPGSEGIWGMARDVVLEMLIGAAGGYAIGRLARWRASSLRLPAQGLLPAFTIGTACLAYGVPTLLHGSGFLAVYVAGITLGNGELPQGENLRRVHDATAWLGQILRFLLLGLLVFPSRLAAVAGVGLGIALLLAFVTRPLVVAICLAPFRLPAREVLYVGWVGLRGAVPIILATIPVLSGAPGSSELFDVVFFVIVVGSILPGATVPWVTRRLGLLAPRELPTAADAV